MESDSDYKAARDLYMKEGERIYCHSTNGRKTNYWIEGAITDAELGLLVDMVLASKILTQEESQSLAVRLINLSGKELDAAIKYRYRVNKQPYIMKVKENYELPVAVSEVAQRVYIVRKAIEKQKKVLLLAIHGG